MTDVINAISRKYRSHMYQLFLPVVDATGNVITLDEDEWMKTVGKTSALLLWLLPFGYGFPAASRRQMLEKFVIATVLADPTSTSAAVRGAAELDLEYYVRDLVGGNKREGNVQQSRAPDLPLPRTIRGDLQPLLLDDSCSINCAPTRALLKIAGKALTGEKFQSLVNKYRQSAEKSFNARAPWRIQHITDQYYFDLTTYAFWRAAADILPDYIDRDNFARELGRILYHDMLGRGFVGGSPKNHELSNSIGAMKQILDVFVTSGFCRGFMIGDERADANGTPLFDQLDDDTMRSGASVDCLVSVYEPATLGASLQITGEQSRFAPDYVGSTLAALWETNGIECTWETFFVDNEYRPNPKDYFPNEQLFQFTLYRHM